MKIQRKIEEYYMYLHIKCGFNEKVLLDELQLFAPKGLVGFFKVKEQDKKKVCYSGIKAISLKEKLMEKPVTKFEFFFIVEQFLMAIQQVEEAHLSLNSIVYDIDKVFVTESTNELQLIYLPLSSNISSKTPMDFLEAFIYSALSVRDNKFISDFALYLRKQTGFSVKNIEEYIKQIEPKVIKILKDEEFIVLDDVNNTLPKANKVIVPETVERISSEEEKRTVLGNMYADSESGTVLGADKKMDEYSEVGTVLGADKKIDEYAESGTVLGVDRKTNEYAESGTVLADDNETVIANDVDEESTVLIGCGENIGITPYLIQKSTNDIIKINQSFFRFGSKEGIVDYRIQNNNTVSRMHADIIIKQQRCFLVDLDSKNKTYVNNRPIQPRVEVEIFDGDIIKFSNEEFEFYI